MSGSRSNTEGPHGGCASAVARLARRSAALALVLTLGACGNNAAVVSSSATALPTVSLLSTPTTVLMGRSAVLQWKAAEAQSCTASGGWSGPQPVSGTLSTDPLTATTSYTLTCTGTGGSATQSIDVAVVQPAPTVTLGASPTTVTSGGASVLTWSTTDATACTASGGWQGTMSAQGTFTTSALTSTTDFALTCTGPGGSATQSTTVTVSAQGPAVTLQASPSTVASGGASTLTWSSQNASACSASGAWSGSLSPSGSQSTGPITANSTYTLTCSGPGGTAAQSATVTVTSSGTGSATLNWTPPTQDTDGGSLTPLSGYTVYYGTSAAALTQSTVVSGATTVSYTVTGLASGTWYFGVTADARDGTKSALSNIGSKTL